MQKQDFKTYVYLFALAVILAIYINYPRQEKTQPKIENKTEIKDISDTLFIKHTEMNFKHGIRINGIYKNKKIVIVLTNYYKKHGLR